MKYSNACLRLFVVIRESVDSLCRDGADTDTPIYQMERLIAPERYSYKPLQTYNKALREFLYHIRPSKYVKYTYTMTYGNCHTSVFEHHHHHHLLLLLLLLFLQTVYLKIDKRAHLYFSIKRFLSLRSMILGQQNRRRIPLARERQGFTGTSV